MKIIEIKLITHTKIKDYHHNDLSMFETDILEIMFEDRSVRKISLFMDKDITDVDYCEVVKMKRSKEKVIMHDIDEDDRIFY